MAAYAEIKTDEFPLVKVKFTGEKADVQNFRAYLEALDEVYSRHEKVALIFDATRASLPNLKFQKLQASWLKENTPLLKQYCLGTAYIIQSAAVRAILRMIFFLTPQPVPYELFIDEEDAREWANQLFKAES
jgi:hypothetical protein